MVRKKQIRMSIAMMTTKRKLASVSKPSQLAMISSGVGNMAMRIKISGRESQAMECRMDIRFLARQRSMRISRTIAAMKNSICRFGMLPSP